MKNHFPIILSSALLIVPALGVAHHSGAMFDGARTQTLEGVVTEFNWVNPHSSFKVDVAGADGKHEIWAVEMSTPQNLVRDGWKRTTLKPGDKLTAVVRPMRNGQPGGSYVSVTLQDGTKLGGNSAATNTPTTAPAAGTASY
ncbi:MAG: DUF6152 family protein [Steroidobacteraceae bacterium]